MFTPIPALIGGALIGASASLLLLSHGRVAGIAGICGELIRPSEGARGFRAWFLAGMIAAGVVAFVLRPASFGVPSGVPLWGVAAAGALVGFGTRLGNGCTSGHGVCGISRLSLRSIVATVIFIATGAATVLLLRHMRGGA